jgi:hypothetical protein
MRAEMNPLSLLQSEKKVGGRDRDRTGDPLLAKHTGKALNALSDVAYTKNQRNFRSSNVPKLYRIN